MRRYELMLVLRPDTPDDRVQQILDRITRGDRRRRRPDRQGQPVGPPPPRLPHRCQYREGSYFIIRLRCAQRGRRGARARPEHHRGGHAPPRHAHRAAVVRAAPGSREDGEGLDELDLDEADALPPAEDEDAPDGEFIDESESEAAPGAID